MKYSHEFPNLPFRDTSADMNFETGGLMVHGQRMSHEDMNNGTSSQKISMSRHNS